MSEHIEPCPFCRGLKISGRDHGDGTPTVWMVCEDCGARGPPDDWRGNAIARWNIRAKPHGDVGADSGLAAADDNHKALVEGIKAIAERWIYRTAHHGPEHLCSGIAQEIAAMAAAQSRQEESR